MGLLEQLLAAQEKTNTLLETLISSIGAANGTNGTNGTKGDDAKTDDKATGKGKTTGKGKKSDDVEKSKPKHTKDEVVNAVVAVKDAFGAKEAKAITAQFGYARIAEAKEEHFDAIFDACEAKLLEAESDDGEEEV